MQQYLRFAPLLFLSALLVGCGGSSNIKSTMPMVLHDSTADNSGFRVGLGWSFD